MTSGVVHVIGMNLIFSDFFSGAPVAASAAGPPTALHVAVTAALERNLRRSSFKSGAPIFW